MMKKFIICLMSMLLLCGCSATIYEGSDNTDLTFDDSDMDATYTDTVNLVLSDDDVYIDEEGTYTLSGEMNGSVIVDVRDDEEVQLVLDNVTINSGDFAAIYIVEADKVTITLAEGSVNTLTDASAYTQIDSNDVDAVIFSKADLTINGTGTLVINANYKNGIVSKDDLIIIDGTYKITAVNQGITGKDCLMISDGNFDLNCGGDGLKSNNDEDEDRGYVYIKNGIFNIVSADDAVQGVRSVTIDGGEFNISAHEGIEGTYIIINDGNISITASDDGINAAQKVTGIDPVFEMNGGSLTIDMGQGDTDAIDSNGYIYINGGTITINAQSAFDYDMGAELNGGTVIFNGTQITEITNQFGGGAMGMTPGQMGGPSESGQPQMPGGQNNGTGPQNSGQPPFGSKRY